jgi:hypothetical protein
MARFGGKKYNPGWQAKGARHYGLVEQELLEAWDAYKRGIYVTSIVDAIQGPGKRFRKPKLSLRKLVVEWGALGLPVWDLKRRAKIRAGIHKMTDRLKEKFDMPSPAVTYAALANAEAENADLRAIVEADSGQAPKRAMSWQAKLKRKAEKNRPTGSGPLDGDDVGDAV